MKTRWSSLSTAKLYKDLNGKSTTFAIKDSNGKITECDKWENDYRTRSTVNDETLKKKHIVCVGDSFVYGHGVARGNTMTDYLDNLVSDEYSCFNLGLPGTGFDTALLRLQQWCNEFGDQVHTVYFGLSGLTRLKHWESYKENWMWEDNVYDDNFLSFHLNYLPNESWRDSTAPKWQKHRAALVHKSYTHLMSKVNSIAKLDATIVALTNLSKVHNFNIYFFGTLIGGANAVKELAIIKEQTENYNIKWGETNRGPLMTYFNTKNVDSASWESYHIKNDGHWNAKGNNRVAQVLYNETKQWY
jgi:hypothetical protein